MMPCSKKNFLATISPKNVGEKGGGEVEKFFPGHSKKGRKNFSRHEPIELRVKKLTQTAFHFARTVPIPYTLTASSVKASANKSFLYLTIVTI
jgi:hypothetical protein